MMFFLSKGSVFSATRGRNRSNFETATSIKSLKFKPQMEQSCKLVQARTRKYKPEPGPNPARTRKLIKSPNHARKNPKVKLGQKNLAMLPSDFGDIFVHLKQKSTS